jgi:SOS-response transcriptional repressor LexA
MDYKKWVHQQIGRTAEPRGITKLKASLAKRLGMELPTLHARLRPDGPEFSSDEIEKMAEFFGAESPVKARRAAHPGGNNVVSLHQPSRGNGDTKTLYPVLGAVEAGAFREADMLSQVEPRTIEAGKSASYPHANPMAWVAHGDSMDAAKIFDGMIVLGVDFQDAGGVLTNNMIVVVEQNRGGLIERSVKAVAVFPDRTEFQPRSTNSKHKPIIYKNGNRDDDVEVRILTIIHGGYVDLSH